MKISLKWLQDFVDVKDYFHKPEALATLLTQAGLEVEEMIDRNKAYEGVVTGLILEKDKHPQADKLSLCRVITQPGVVHQIVCGAQNHNEGDRVVVALPGALLPNNFLIKPTNIRGVDSGGMLCSAQELGFAGDERFNQNGIIILNKEVEVGCSFVSALDLDDIIFDLKVTPNRADCLSHFGLAREIAALISAESPEKKMEAHPYLKGKKVIPIDPLSLIQIQIVEEDMCPRYAGRIIKGIKVSPSPQWLKQRLESIGLKSINNIVDITNYVMMELGQPLHAFDLSQLHGELRIEKAQPQEIFITLDGTSIELTGDELMIKDKKKSLAMAGIIGGKNSGVSESTTDIFLETAYFTPFSIRRSSRLHGINTDSGYRFSRGVDPHQVTRAQDRATELIIELAGGDILGSSIDIYPKPLKRAPIEITLNTISDRLGYEAKSNELEDILKRLGCVFSWLPEATKMVVTPPHYRFDLESEMDLVEEYARLMGYDRIPESLPPLSIAPSFVDEKYLALRKISEVLVRKGFQQAVNMIFVSDKAENEFLGNPRPLRKSGILHPSVESHGTNWSLPLINPLSADQNVLRSTLTLGLFQNMVYNFHQQNEFGRLFEWGNVFVKPVQNDEPFLEPWHLGLVAWGQNNKQLWQKEQKYPLIFEVKEAIESLLLSFSIPFHWNTSHERGEIPSFVHWGQFARLEVNGLMVGFLGTLHPEKGATAKIRGETVLCEINLTPLFECIPKAGVRKERVKSISKFPSIERDLALLMDIKIKAQEVLETIQKEGGPSLVHVALFDHYPIHKDLLQEIPPNLRVSPQKSLAFRLKFQDQNATLQESQVNESISRVLKALNEKFSIVVR